MKVTVECVVSADQRVVSAATSAAYEALSVTVIDALNDAVYSPVQRELRSGIVAALMEELRRLE